MTYDLELFVCTHVTVQGLSPDDPNRRECRRSFYREPGQPTPSCGEGRHGPMQSLGLFEFEQQELAV